MPIPNRQFIFDPSAPPPPQEGRPFIWKRRLSFSAFAAAATTGNVDIANFNPFTIIASASFWFTQNFTGGGSTSATLSIGTTADPVAYKAATSVFTGAPASGGVGVALAPFTYLNAASPQSTGTVRFQLISDVNTNLLTAGRVDVVLMLRSLALRTT